MLPTLNSEEAKIFNKQCIKIMKLLEINSGVYSLKINDIPIWWFVRARFYNQLSTYLIHKGEKKEFSKGNADFKKELFASCYRKSIVFLLRSFKSLVCVTINRIPKKPIIFLTYPQGFKKKKEGEEADIFIDTIYLKLIDKAIMVDRPTLTKRDFHSFLHRKNIIFFDWAIALSILKNCFKLLKTPKIDNWNDFENKVKKINFEIISSEWVLEAIQDLISSISKKVIIQVGAAKILIKRFQPRIIVETTSYDSGTMAINLIAQKQNIPIIELQHGIIAPSHIGYTYFVPQTYIENRPLPNKILVYGSAFKNAILSTGNAFLAKNIGISGFPRLNNFLRENQLKKEGVRAEIRRKLDIENDVLLVTATSQPVPNRNLYLSQFLEEVLCLIEKDVIICIKLHSLETDNWELIYQTISSHPQIKIVTDDFANLYELLIASDIHTTIDSTVFLECLALEVPNIVIKGPDYSSLLELVTQDKIVIANSPKEFIEEVSKFQKNEKYRKYIVKKGREMADNFYFRQLSSVNFIIDEITN